MSLLPLMSLSHNEEGRIHSLTVSGPQRDQLQDMGLVPGRRVRLLQAGSPCILVIENATRLCVREDVAESVFVQLP